MREYVTGAITGTTMGIAGWNVTVARAAGTGGARTLAVATGTPGAHNLSEGYTYPGLACFRLKDGEVTGLAVMPASLAALAREDGLADWEWELIQAAEADQAARGVPPGEDSPAEGRGRAAREYRLVVEVAAHVADLVDADLIDDIVPEAVRGALAGTPVRVASVGLVPEDRRPWHARLAGMPIAGGVAACVVPRDDRSAVVLVHEAQSWRYVTGIVFEHDFTNPETGAPRLPREYAYGAHFLYEREPGGTVDRAQETARVLALLSLATRAAGAHH